MVVQLKEGGEAEKGRQQSGIGGRAELSVLTEHDLFIQTAADFQDYRITGRSSPV